MQIYILMSIIGNTLSSWRFYLQFITRKGRVLILHVGCSTEDPNLNVISLVQLYNSHFATLLMCLRYSIIAMRPRLSFTINDEWGVSVFSMLGHNGPIKNVKSFNRCCEYFSGRIITLSFVQIHSCKDNMSVCGKVIDISRKPYVESNLFF